MTVIPQLTRRSLRSRCLALVIGAIALAITEGCVPSGFRVTSVSYGIGFYRPWVYDYRFWGPRYRVGPPRPGPWRPPPRIRPPSFRPPPAGRPMPSLPKERPLRPPGRGLPR